MKVTTTIWFDDLGYFQATKLTIPRSTSSFQFCTLWIAVPKKIEHDRTVISHDIFPWSYFSTLFELFFSTPLRESLVVFELLHQESAPSQLTFINETHPPILPPRDGDSDSTTTPGTDFPWKLATRWEHGRSHDWESRKVPPAKFWTDWGKDMKGWLSDVQWVMFIDFLFAMVLVEISNW